MSKKHSYIIGINAYDHDVSACLLRDGEIAFAIEKERITGQKHDTGFYQEVVDYCLKAEGITLKDVELVVRNCYILPVEDMERRLGHDDYPELLDDDERKQAADSPLFQSKSDKVITISHHLAHAYSAFAVCPYDEGAVMIVDGVGGYASDVTEDIPTADQTDRMARESESYYKFDGSKIETVKKVWLAPTPGFLSDEFYIMPGLGALYSRVSSYIMGDWNACGEVMGLAPYGRENAIKPLVELIDGELVYRDWADDFDKPWFPDGDHDHEWEDDKSQQHWKDIAWQIQNDVETILVQRAIWLRETTGAKNLVMAGGVALNCVANGRIAREAGFDNVWVQPAAGDNGIAIGCAYYGYLEVQKKQRSFVMKHSNLGFDYTKKSDADKPSQWLDRMETIISPSDDICKDTAKLLSEGNIFGWYQGRCEFGPRALGNRSILADPREASMKERINENVKFRQEFRPFAPIVLEERAAEIFEDYKESPFMLLAMSVRPEWRDKIPAIVHVDGSARVQTVTKEQNERLYNLLKEFDALTGIPVLLNTSFNIKGEPIVEKPDDAIGCFLGTGIDYLALNDQLIAKSRFHKLFSPVIGVLGEFKERYEEQRYS